MVMTAYITTHFIIQHPLNKAERQANGQRAALSAFYSHISQTRKHPRLYLEASDLSNQTWFPAFVTPQLVTRNQWNAIDTTDPYLLQLRRAPNIAAKCFIQTDQGCTFATCELDYCWQVLSYATSWWRPRHIFFSHVHGVCHTWSQAYTKTQPLYFWVSDTNTVAHEKQVCAD